MSDSLIKLRKHSIRYLVTPTVAQFCLSMTNRYLLRRMSYTVLHSPGIFNICHKCFLLALRDKITPFLFPELNFNYDFRNKKGSESLHLPIQLYVIRSGGDWQELGKGFTLLSIFTRHHFDFSFLVSCYSFS